MDKCEKVIKGLECCIKRDPDDKTRCGECPYEGACLNRLKLDALALLKALYAFKSYFDDLYGAGPDVANYHLNGATEPFDGFYDSAMEEMRNAR